MENARDSFYITLRNRLSTVNPARTMLLRGVQRPGILVETNESRAPYPPADVFVLRWTESAVETSGPMLLAQQLCEIVYATEGTNEHGGLDRGRALTAMDTELMSMLQPTSAPKLNFATTPPAVLSTRIFWSEPMFSPVTTLRDQLSRSVQAMVFSYEEAGEQ